MGFFDRSKRKKGAEKSAGRKTGEQANTEAPSVPAPEAETKAIILLGKNVGLDAVSRAAEAKFGPQVLASADNSHPLAPAVYFQLEGVEFFCSYMAMPHPPQVADLAAIPAGLFSPEEREEMLKHQAFLVLAQRDGGTTLEDKRRLCCLFTRLAAALLETESASGVYVSSAELLISRSVYLKHAGILEQNLQDPAYFPAPLWISIRHGQKGEYPLIGTWGLKQFGLLELWFLSPDADWAEIHQRLYLLSIFEITGKDLYKNMDTIQFTPGKTSVFKELHGALFITAG